MKIEKVKNELQLLIEHLKAEKQYLEKELNLNIEQKDFEAAHHFSKALDLVKGKLHALADLDNTHQLKIEQRKSALETMEKKFSRMKFNLRSGLPAESLKRMEAYWKQEKIKRVEKVKEEIKRLESQAHRKQLDQEVIDEMISSLASGVIKSFRINLVKKDDFSILFEMSSTNQLVLCFPKSKIVQDSYWMKKRFVNKLIGMGFEYKNSRLQIEINDFSDSIHIKELLARILFDVYLVRNIDKDITLEILA